MPRTTSLLVLLGLCACSPNIREVEDFEELCVGAKVIQGTPDRALEATVTFDTCIKDCDTVEVAKCEVETADGIVTVTGEARVAREGRNCSKSCEPATATCEVVTPPGDYLVEAAELSLEVSHPVVGSECVTLD